MSKKQLKYVGWLFFALVLYFPVFLRLGSNPIALWDESLFGLRALYMADNWKYLYDFNLYPELRNHQNTKLPFTTFLQALGLKAFGVNELGLRIPISIIFLSTIGVILYYFKRYYASFLIAVLFSLSLVSSVHFVQMHMLRSGDQDVPFACYLIIAILSFYHYTERKSTPWLVAFTLAMIAAFLTKNLLAGLIAPGILLYVIAEGRLTELIRDKAFWFSLTTICLSYLITLGYFEWQHPGFVNRMWEYELMGRYKEVIESHTGGQWFFLETFFRPYAWGLLPLCLLVFDKRFDPELRRLVLLLIFCFLSYLTIISFSKTKLFWYAAPLYPIAALIMALCLHHTWTHILAKVPTLWKRGTLVLVLALFSFSYRGVILKISERPDTVYGSEYYGWFMKHLHKTDSDLKRVVLLDRRFASATTFIQEKYNRAYGYRLEYSRSFDLALETTVMSCHADITARILDRYEVEELETYEQCVLLKIISSK